MSDALVPGSYDPITNGHIDIIERSARVFDKVWVTIFTNSSKKPLFSVEERLELIKEAVSHLDNVVVDSSEGLLVDYARERGISVVVKGLRAVSDFEYELQMAQMNKRLDPKLETFFVTTNVEYSYLSSSIIKVVVANGGSIKGLVPKHVEEALVAKLDGRGC